MSAAPAPAPNPRQSLRLLINTPTAFRSVASAASASPLSAFARKESWSYESPSGECYDRICSVIGLYDFSSSDPDHLSFRQNEVLEVVRQEESGWWAAVRSDGSEVGWIPASYVRTLSDDTAEKVYSIREETRIPRYANDLGGVKSAPALLRRLVDTPSSGATFSDGDSLDTTRHSDFDLASPPPLSNSSDSPGIQARHREPIILTEDDTTSTLVASIRESTNSLTLSDSSTIILPDSHGAKPLLRLDKSLPASPEPTSAAPNSFTIEPKFGLHNRSSSSGPISPSDRTRRRRPLLLDDQSSLQRLSSVIQTHNLDQLASIVSPTEDPLAVAPISPSYAHPRPGKVLQLTGDDSAQAFHNAKRAQATLPWYLRNQHGEDEIKLDYDGTVKAGTLSALVERLVVDPLRVSQQETFRRAFLVTFRTFASATEVFDLLIAQYELDVPANLSQDEFEHWKREKLRPTQKRVLTVLTMWLEEYDLLNRDPEVAPKLQAFLSLIVSPATMALTAKHMLKSLERLTFADTPAPETSAVPASKKWKKVRKGDSIELARMDPSELAQHLTLFEYNLYNKIRAQECFTWTKTRDGEAVQGINAFCATHDKLAGWVKLSILEVDGLGKRAHIVDFWIRVAEKCRSLNNFSSMSSIVAALSTTAVSRLHFTWVNSSKESSLELLRKINIPTSNYAYYRSILDSIEGPCIPFVGPFLKNIIYAQEQHEDNVTVQSTTNPEKEFTLIHFVKRQKWYDVTTQMLRFQEKPYGISEIPGVTSFITGQMVRATGKEDSWFWKRSDDLQQAELVHADIRKGLEAAGF